MSARVDFEMAGLNDGSTVKSSHIVTSVRVESKFGHDHVTLFNRGANAGTLIVNEGDGVKICTRLFGLDSYRRIEVPA